MKNKTKRGYIFAILGVFAIVFALVGALSLTEAYGNSKKRAEDDAPTVVMGRRYTYLLLGKDRASGLTDVMMLLSVDTKSKRASVVQIPRDTYARYSEGGYRKINGALASLGAKELCAFFEKNMSVSLDGYFLFDLDVFSKAVDAVGGVEIDLPYAMSYRDESQDLDIRLEAGHHTLDGEKAEQFVRYRSGYLRGDLGRIDAQKLFISSLIKKVKSEISVSKALKIASGLWGEIDTDVKLSELSAVALCVFDINEENIDLVTLAGEDIRSKESGAWYYVLSKGSCERILFECVGADGAFDADGVFRNPASSDFERIYNADVPYKVRNSRDISENGIEIAKQ